MTTTWDKKEKESIAEYGCELLVENASQDELKNYLLTLKMLQNCNRAN